jgi:membrane protein implicated in regulation of membrane protease activity
MESVFLACFLFGALFTVASTVLGALGSGTGHDAGAGHAHAHFGDAHGHPPHGAGGHTGAHAAGTLGAAAHDSPAGDVQNATAGFVFPPLLNFSSLVAFLTWFGAAGYALLHFAGWPLAGALALAIAAGLAGAVLIALFLGQVLAGEQVLDARQYRLPGTLARVTVGIPATGVGEIVFAKGGGRRSEAARSLTGRPIARDTEVVILEYGKGVAAVQPFQELLEGKEASADGALPAPPLPPADAAVPGTHPAPLETPPPHRAEDDAPAGGERPGRARV